MSIEKPYQPSAEEIEKAESMMTLEEIKSSKEKLKERIKDLDEQQNKIIQGWLGEVIPLAVCSLKQKEIDDAQKSLEELERIEK